MAKKPDRPTKSTALRRQAEEFLQMTKHDVAAMPVKDVQQLVSELQVHQIELEMQNEELRQTQAELGSARDRYVDLYDFSPIGYLTLDKAGTIVEANLRAGTLLGIDRRALLGQPLARMLAAGHEVTFRRHWQEVLTSGRRQSCEVLLRNEKGPPRWVYLESLAVHEESGPLTHWRTALLDVSDRKLAEQAMEAQRAQLEGVISSAMDAIITVDEEEHVVVFNRTAESMFLCQAADSIGQPLDRFIPERFRQAHPGHMRDFALTQVTSRSMGQSGNLFGLRSNGEEFPIEASISHVLVGDKMLFTVILRDVTARKQAEQEQVRLIEDLTRSQEHFQTLFNWVPSAVGISTLAEGRFCDVNDAFSRLTGYVREEVIGRTTLELGLWADPSERASVLREIQEQGHLHNREGLLRTKSGEIRSLMISVASIRLGSTPSLIYLAHDITERKRGEDALQASEVFTRAVLNSLSAPICVLDRDGVILKTNDAWQAFAGWASNCPLIGADIGQHYGEVCRLALADAAAEQEHILGGIQAVLTGSRPGFSTEYACHVLEDERWFQLRVTPLKASKGAVVSHTDISPRVSMGVALEQQLLLLNHKQAELESLTGKLIGAQEQERRRIARELHDDFNQRLAALAVELETLERTPNAVPTPVVQQLISVRDHVGQLSDDLHDMAYRLHPSLLEHVGLEVAARDHVLEFTKRTGLPVTWTAREVPEALAPEVATNLFRVMQESLQNVFKHARATEVTVTLSGSSKGVGLSVRDNGQGFDLKGKDARMKGIGLVSMQERMRLMGGFLRIHSLPADGTTVCAWIPRAQEGT
ncbi:MAG: PAS domain S-box protein [Nitrospirota bacterium]|nr:PAS domain S-box protein [Nitrospirota bacterium]MDP2382060.1 PAS domain S-box protein [Nitrospirota bacterium]MDP3599396.1 PAS domain S-box protein [Nitrospirota bacterium]